MKIIPRLWMCCCASSDRSHQFHVKGNLIWGLATQRAQLPSGTVVHYSGYDEHDIIQFKVRLLALLYTHSFIQHDRKMLNCDFLWGRNKTSRLCAGRFIRRPLETRTNGWLLKVNASFSAALCEKNFWWMSVRLLLRRRRRSDQTT